MKKIIVFFGILTIAGILGGALFVLGIVHTSTVTKAELGTTRSALTEKEAEIALLKAENETLKDKMSATREYASFLSLALCPTLESGDRGSFCMRDGAEWLNQTIQAGAAVPDTAIKTSMDAFAQSLGNPKKISSKQFYETLKSLEARALRLIIESTSD